MLVYLASPYTPHGGESIEERAQAACKAAAKLMLEGVSVFAPVPHSHVIADYLPRDVRMNHAFWMIQDLAVLRHCDRMVVLTLPGWERSRGIQREIQFARENGIPVEFRAP